ncbi:MAG TPA: hypothetical protein VNO75_01670 [Gemmatimonadaceae bacterium]|nr:hypothetical protein [Gemmatimonadaceae bacterium]
MRNARLRLMAGLAGAAMCLFAVTSYGQTPTTTPGSPDASAQPTTPATPAPSGPVTDPIVPGTGTEVLTTTETTTWSFPGGIWGILAVAVLAILILFAVFRRRDTTVVNETYVSPNTGPGARNAGMGTAVGDRNLSPRAAQGTEPPTRGGVNDRGGTNDPNTRL